MNYTRKRAILACNFCRHRKRRCDGEQPCSTCRESNADCQYKDLPIDRVEIPSTPTESVTEQLGRIETLLKEQNQELRKLTRRPGLDGSVAGFSSRGSFDGQTVATATEAPDAISISVTSSDTPGSLTTSPPAPIASPASVNPLLGVDAASQYHHHAYQQYPNDNQYQQTFFHEDYAAIPYHGANTTNTGVPTLSLPPTLLVPSISAPVLATSSVTPAYDFHAVGSHSLYPGRGLALDTPDVSPHSVELHQPPQQRSHSLLASYETSTASDALLSSPLVRYFLEHLQSINNRNETEPERNRKIKPKPTTYKAAVGTTGISFFFPRNYFVNIETGRPLPKQLHLIYSPGFVESTWPPPILATSHPAVLSSFVDAYFTHVHSGMPLFTFEQFLLWSSNVYDKKHDDSIETAICLTVWALGALVSAPVPASETASAPPRGAAMADAPNNQAECEEMALSLFQPAFKIILHYTLWEFGPASLAACIALLLAASYFSHIGRPLHNARMVHLASRKLLRLVDEQNRDGRKSELDRDLLSVFWVCFLWESECAAEFNVPQSGIEPLADRMPLPISLGANDDGEIICCFSAEVLVRKLFNRIHKRLYEGQAPMAGGNEFGALSVSCSTTSGRKSPAYKRRRAESELPTAAEPSPLAFGIDSGISGTGADRTGSCALMQLLPISAQLNSQLEEWYYAIPDPIRPPLVGCSYDKDYVRYDDNKSSIASGQAAAAAMPLSHRVQILRLHYYAARHIIHRPFVLGVAWQQQQQMIYAAHESNTRDGGRGTKSEPLQAPLPPAVIEKCAICIDSCIAFLLHVLPLLDHQSHYLWSFCQSSLACLLVLLVVSACPEMSLPAAASQADASSVAARKTKVNIGRLRDQVAKKLRRWAIPGSGFAAELHIVENLPVPLSAPTMLTIPAIPTR